VRGALAALFAALALHLVAAGSFVLHLPVHEGPDEPGHYDYVFRLARTGERPWVPGTSDGVHATTWDETSMAHHPALYYAVLAGLGRAVAGDLPAPTPNFGDAPAPLQTRHGHDERAPRSDEVRLVLLLRGVSVLCGALSLVLLWATARRLAPNEPAVAVLATGLLACLPQWHHAHAVLDNGALGTTACFAALYALACIVTASDERRAVAVSWRAALALGVCTGAALATKLTGLLLLPLAGLVALRVLWRSERRALALARVATALVLALAPLAHFAAQNLERYGEPLARGVHARAYAVSTIAAQAAAAGLDEDVARSLYMTERFPREFARSLVGVFGWNAVSVPEHTLATFGVVALLGAVGVLLALVRARPRPWRVVLMAGGVAALALAQVVTYNLEFVQPQGRYAFPGVGGLALLVGLGLAHLAGRVPRGTGVVPGSVPRVAITLVLGACALQALYVALVQVPRAFGEPVRAALADADPRLAAFVGALGRAPADAGRELAVFEPDDGATLDAPPTFRFEPARQGTTTLHVWLGDGQFLGGTFEHQRLAVDSGTWSLPAGLWAGLPAGTVVWWQVRRVPDRARGESAADVERSAPRHVVKR
jgi:hypothetical protein